MTITLTPDIEQALTRQSHQSGKPVEQVALDTLRENLLPAMDEKYLQWREQLQSLATPAGVSPSEAERESARIVAIRTGRGSLSSPLSLVDELHAERQRDKIREEQESEQWFMPSTPDQ